MQITFIDTEESWKQMLPISYTRPVSEARVGILKIHEKWSKALSAEKLAFRSQDYLGQLFEPPQEKSLTILGNVLPTSDLLAAIKGLKQDEGLIYEDQMIAGFYAPDESFELGERKPIAVEVKQVVHPWDIFRMNGEEIKHDFELLTKERTSQSLDDTHTKTYGDQIFLEEGAWVKAAVLNAENGPIYIGKNAEIQEGALIRGPFALCDHSTINMGAKIKGDTTIGPHCKVGGEVSNSVIFGYSNKGHEGFLGNSVIGEWCNLGADTNNSNLKNNYANVKMWDFASGRFKDTGLQFCGLIMGDHSKCGINTMFNTGTTVGVSANIFGDGFPRTIIPSFAWGGSSGFTTYQTRKAFETAELVMKRRNKTFSEADKAMLSHIFEITAENRVWEKK
ncbi:GlmU family protein [Ekhidna sp.]|uniref:GlmU family protein n=1 Tax=Ekhidna sp. TaxID=2608089 RepID=UPI003CCB85BC